MQLVQFSCLRAHGPSDLLRFILLVFRVTGTEKVHVVLGM